jgi:hypothetical protein
VRALSAMGLFEGVSVNAIPGPDENSPSCLVVSKISRSVKSR